MNARDDLAKIIDDRWHGYGYNPQGAADAILAAGYVKHRTITTIAELDALPDGTAVMSRYGNASTIYRYNPLLTPESYHFLLNSEGDYVTVLFEPEAEQ
jgi:hypothetical protein